MSLLTIVTTRDDSMPRWAVASAGVMLGVSIVMLVSTATRYREARRARREQSSPLAPGTTWPHVPR